jgi:hypothetical protein
MIRWYDIITTDIFRFDHVIGDWYYVTAYVTSCWPKKHIIPQAMYTIVHVTCII